MLGGAADVTRIVLGAAVELSICITRDGSDAFHVAIGSGFT